MIISSPITGKTPKISINTFIAETAVIIGDVHIESGVNIWYGAVIRGDEGKIIIGKNSSIQENVVIHTEPNTECVIKDHIIVGHQAMIHGPCQINSGTLIGINSVVLQDCIIGKGVVVGAGAVARDFIADFSLVVGQPALFKKKIDPIHFQNMINSALKYTERGIKFIEKGLNHPNISKFHIKE